MKYYYSTTVRKVQLPVFITDYRNYLHKLQKDYPLAEIKAHYEGTKGLHVHLMIKTPKKMYINKMHPGRGWNIDHQLCKNNAAWECYINKDSKKEAELINYEELKEMEFFDTPVQSEEEDEINELLTVQRIV